MGHYDVSNPRTPTAIETPLAANHGVVAIHRATGQFATAVAGFESSLPDVSLVQLQQWTPNGTTETWSIPEQTPRTRSLELRFDPEGERLLRVRLQNASQVLSTRIGEVLAEIETRLHRAAFAGSQGLIVAIPPPKDGHQGIVQLIDPTTGEVRMNASTPLPSSTLAVSSDSKLIAVAGSSQDVIIFDADMLKRKHHLYAHDDMVSALKFHPTKPILATGSIDHTVKLWNYETGKHLQTLLGFAGRPLHLTFSPNGRLLVVEGMEMEMKIFEVEDERD